MARWFRLSAVVDVSFGQTGIFFLISKALVYFNFESIHEKDAIIKHSRFGCDYSQQGNLTSELCF